MVGSDGVLPLPWLDEPLRRTLATVRAHALLIHGPQGVGQFELAVVLAQAWLCEVAATEAGVAPRRPCGTCASCRLVQAHTHPDLLVLLPEALRGPLGWSVSDDEADADDEKAGKRKPSKDIRVDEVRLAIAFAQKTTSRGRCKVVVMYPAERMNGISANALLKTLEEPPGDARLILASASPDALLPTIRSRCHALPLPLPDRAMASEWLGSQSVAQADLMLTAAGGQPLDALQWKADGLSATTWAALPHQIVAGEFSAVLAWTLPRVIEMLQKLCHDAMRVSAGAPPRYFPAESLSPLLPELEALGALVEWSKELTRVATNAEHPWNNGLMIESLLHDAKRALAPALSPASQAFR